MTNLTLYAFLGHILLFLKHFSKLIYNLLNIRVLDYAF
jgi:hypothetical protein